MDTKNKSRPGLSALAGVQRGLTADLLGFPVDTAANVVDLGLAGYGSFMGALGRPDLAPDLLDRAQLVGSGDWVAQKLSRTGALMGPVDPDSEADRALFSFGRGGAGAILRLRAGPVSAVKAGTLGGASAVVADEVGASTENPALAVLAASLVDRGRDAGKGRAPPAEQGRHLELPNRKGRESGGLEWHKAFADTLAHVLPKGRDSRHKPAGQEQSDIDGSDAKDVPGPRLVNEEQGSPAVDPTRGQVPNQPQARPDMGDDNVGAMRRLRFSPVGYHSTVDTLDKSRGPVNGQDALDTSVPLGGQSRRRIGIDYDRGEFVVFDYTEEGTYHGHVRSWDQLRLDMQNTLRKAGMVDKRGRIRGSKNENGG